MAVLTDSRPDYGDLSSADKRRYVGLASELRSKRSKKKAKAKKRLEDLKKRGKAAAQRRKNEKKRGH